MPSRSELLGNLCALVDERSERRPRHAAVVFESGLGNDGSVWGQVQPFDSVRISGDSSACSPRLRASIPVLPSQRL